MQALTLSGRTIAVPESRELDVFAALLERRGAIVIRCPLVGILDAPNPAPVLEWVAQFNRGTFNDLILLTGEGLHRMLSCIERHCPSLRSDFLAQLAAIRKITRGPKPARALRELGFRPDLAAEYPTTQGVIATLQHLDLRGHHVAVQLYGTEPNRLLIDFLQAAGAHTATVAPYVYTSDADDQTVRGLLQRMAQGQIDVIAFTSSAQVERLFDVGPAELARAALERTQVAAVGPVVADALARHQVTVRFMPQEAFFMKPLANAIADKLD